MRKARITLRRIEILKCISQGYNNNEIAIAMDMGIDNVKLQISRAINYFGVRTRHEAVEMAIQCGFFHRKNMKICKIYHKLN